MSRPLKWTLFLLGGVSLILLALYLYVRLTIGAVNFTFGEEPLDPARFSQHVEVPEGMNISVWADGIPNARYLKFTPDGRLLVANPNLGQILILTDTDGDGRADQREVLMTDLNGPNGMDFRGDQLYIAETDAIGRVSYDAASGAVTGSYERLVTGLPQGENHWKKTLRFGPDGLLYVTMGSSCNVCKEADGRRAAMVTYDPEGGNETIFALGLRNSAGFDWSPTDGQIYATDNGRDGLGDDYPPCELNQVQAGKHYGWPFVNGDNRPDPDFGDDPDAGSLSFTPPVHDFRAHNAPLGITFLRSESWPSAYRYSAVVALHGSWNRSEKDGYKVVSLHWREDGSIEERDLVTGFLNDGEVSGRPAEVTEGPDGALYISDDFAGAVYRVAPGEQQAFSAPAAATVASGVTDGKADIAELPAATRERLQMEGAALVSSLGCAECHGDEPGKVLLTGLANRYNVESMITYMAAPTPPMPRYDLSEVQRRAIAVQLLSQDGL